VRACGGYEASQRLCNPHPPHPQTPSPSSKNPTTQKVARLAANLTVVANYGWTTTTVSSVNVSYAVLNASTAVNPGGWNQAIDWVVRQAGAKLALSQIWDSYVKTPVAPFFTLENVVTGAAGGQWRGLSADVRLTQPVARGGGGGGEGAEAAAAAWVAEGLAGVMPVASRK